LKAEGGNQHGGVTHVVGLGEVAAVVQAAAFAAHEGRAHDQVGHLHQVAQLQQVARDVEVGVELLDFALQQGDAVGGALQPLVGAHDAHVVPHEAAQFVPVVETTTSSSASVTRLSSQARQGGAFVWGASVLMALAAADANTMHSSSELLARRLAPCRPVQVVSPTAYSPVRSVRPCRSVTTPPQV
jgi:hypothetical protein